MAENTEVKRVLPDWFDIDGKVDRGEDLTALERFVYAFDIAEPEQSDAFRKGLLAVLREVKNEQL